MQPKVIRDAGERPLVLFSDSSGIVADKTFLQRSLLFAELAMIAYNDEAEVTRAAAEIGFPDVTFFNNRGAQAFRFRNRHNSVIACRGTEPNEWTDIRADVDAVSVLAETAGKVHRGFKREVDNLWPMLETSLMNNKQPVYFAGHSLGGAMAKICASRCLLSHISTNPQQLFTYGSPRVGNRSYVKFVTIDHYRFVNNNDVVTRVPPIWLGYQHSGYEIYFNRNGDIKQYGYLMKRRDRWRGFLKELVRWKVDHIGDHSIHRYCENLVKAVLAEKESIAAGGEPYTPCKLTIAPPDAPH
ncbi:MAG TPA: lipase [Planctomycetaceae bacterium]|nr:lipase [Planctomycetaceae bacterium]